MAKDDPIASFRFTVEVDGVAVGAFTEITLPNFEIETEQVKEGGLNDFIHTLPGRGKPGNVTLKHGLMLNDTFMQWTYQVMVNAFGSERFKTMTVVIFNNNHLPLYRIDFDRAFPVKWTGPSLKSSESAVAIESIEIAHQGVTYTYLASGAATSPVQPNRPAQSNAPAQPTTPSTAGPARPA